MGGGWGKGPTRLRWIKKDQGRSKEITVMGGFPIRSRRIKMDQEGSGQIKGDHCDGWGCGCVSNQIKEDQDGSRKIKEDQDGSRKITVMGRGVGGFPTRSRRIKMDQDRSRRIRADQRRSL